MQHRFTVSEAIELHVIDCQAQRFTKDTLRFYRGRLRLLSRWCNSASIIHIDELSHIHLRKFLAGEAERGMSACYVHGTARAIRAFLNFCVKDELIESSPFDKVKMPRFEDKILPALTNDEIARLLKACENARDRAIVLFLLDSGVRANELCNLNVGDMDTVTGAVSVRQGKQQKDRTTHIGARTRKQVKRYLMERGSPVEQRPLFVSRRDTRLSYSGLAQSLQRVREIADVPNASAHAFRRTFAITCLCILVKTITESGRKRSRILVHADQTFWTMAITE